MTIGNAVQRKTLVHVYDTHGKNLFVKAGKLHGFTSSTVVLKVGRLLVTYSETGRQIAATSAS
ncbi:MAG: hypothetical protein KGJ57_20325 [Sphingomonadales bacterium]|nr:hypothetical protein [Sphingomonadales bacterium]